ncbi:RNA polymerase sigma factor [Azospirillum sp. B4]|uniref:RNA polymerase sigma factor n=1 Tax=Azospirillum sp. B4 TaxID=95605 RepID=UPI00034C3F15|nr:RNA polymerase sigma factor [Azospirillum sp. B4]
MDNQADARADGDPPSRLDAAEFEAHQSVLRGYFARRVRQAQDVDDYVQDVYLRALAAAPARGVDNWRAFLLRVANSLLIDRFRRNAVRHQDAHHALDDVAELVDDGIATPERTVMFRQELACLEAALRDVDPLARHAFLLVRVDGLSHREVASRLGLEVKMVSRQIERVLAHLARTMVEPAR